MSDSSVKSKKHPSEPDDLEMPAQKKRRSKSVKSAASSASTSSTSTHSYLGNQELSIIEHWNSHIPAKPTPATNLPRDQEAVVQAYVAAKLELFKNMHTCVDQRNT